MRPNSRTSSGSLGAATWAAAIQKGLAAGRENLRPMLALQAAMAMIVAIYYLWPPGSAFLVRLGTWQAAGGVLAAGLATALAGGALSEISTVYFQQGGRWSMRNLEHGAFGLGLFFMGGVFVFEFYHLQAIWWGRGASWSVLIPKILTDQFGYTLVWAAPYQTLLTRWEALGYSRKKLGQELRTTFVPERLLPVIVTNWMFWLPGVTLIYAMPADLQTSLFIFATAIWGILLPAAAHPVGERSSGTLQDLVTSQDVAAPVAE